MCRDHKLRSSKPQKWSSPTVHADQSHRHVTLGCLAMLHHFVQFFVKSFGCGTRRRKFFSSLRSLTLSYPLPLFTWVRHDWHRLHSGRLIDCLSNLWPAGFQLIHYAVEGGNREIVKFLIDNDFGKPDMVQDDRAFTPLHLAARAGHAELVSLLLNVGYQADRPDKNGRTPLHCAAEGGHIGWLEANQANLMNPPGQMRPRIDHRYITRELLAQGVDPTTLDDDMCSALHYACSKTSSSLSYRDADNQTQSYTWYLVKMHYWPMLSYIMLLMSWLIELETRCSFQMSKKGTVQHPLHPKLIL